MRPEELKYLKGDPSKAKRCFGVETRIHFFIND
jgi:GDP-D-mannose dehydratase